MGKTIKARFSKGVIEPLEKIDIDEGKEITITIIEVPASLKKEDVLEIYLILCLSILVFK